MKEHELYIEYLTSKKSDNDKVWYFYQVFGNNDAIEHYQQTSNTPLWSRETGVPMYASSVPLGKSLKLRYDAKDNRYFGNTDDYRMYRDIAMHHEDKPSVFKYYMDKAEEARTVVIPQEIKDVTPTKETMTIPATTHTGEHIVVIPEVSNDVNNSTTELNVW
jgi:hypothetical protein